jgi:hypothetical protein
MRNTLADARLSRHRLFGGLNRTEMLALAERRFGDVICVAATVLQGLRAKYVQLCFDREDEGMCGVPEDTRHLLGSPSRGARGNSSRRRGTKQRGNA